MKRVLSWLLGALVLLGLTYVSLLAISDAYVNITALRGEGSPGKMTITTSERNWHLLFTTCYAEGTFVADAGGQPRSVVLDGDCSPEGSALRVQYTPSLRDVVGLPVSVEKGTWGDVLLVLFMGSVFIAITVAAWATAMGMIRDGDTDDGWRYQRVRLATSADQDHFEEWLNEHFDAAWVEPLPSGGTFANIAMIDDVLLSDLEDVPSLGTSLADLGAEACVMRWPEHTHFGLDGAVPHHWMDCSLSPQPTADGRVVTVVACSDVSTLFSVGGPARAVQLEEFCVVDQDCANRNSVERESAALMIALRGGRVSLSVHEDGVMMARAAWNHRGRVLGEGSPQRLRALCPTWPLEVWPDELSGLALPDRDRLAELLASDSEPEPVIRQILEAWGLPTAVIVAHLTGARAITDLPGATTIEPRTRKP